MRHLNYSVELLKDDWFFRQLNEIMAAILDFNGSGRLGRERNFYQEGGRRSNMRRGVGLGGEDYPLPRPSTLTPNQSLAHTN